MKKIKLVLMLLVMSLTMIIKPVVIFGANSNTEIDVKLNQSDTTKNSTGPKDSIYKPKESNPVSFLPQTGEILTSFLFILLGLSILLFIIGLFINRDNSVNIKWGY